MTLIRATLTESNRTWIAYGETRTEAVYRLRCIIERHVITTGERVNTLEIIVQDVTKEHEQLVQDYIAAAYPTAPTQ